MSKASSMRGKCFQPLKLFWHKDSWKGRSSSHVLYLLSFKAWHMVLPLRGRRILFFEDWSAISGASLVGQKADENAALDEIVEAMWEDQKGNQDFQQVCSRKFWRQAASRNDHFLKENGFYFSRPMTLDDVSWQWRKKVKARKQGFFLFLLRNVQEQLSWRLSEVVWCFFGPGYFSSAFALLFFLWLLGPGFFQELFALLFFHRFFPGDMMRRKVSEKSNISGRCVTAEYFQQDLREKNL